MALDVAGPLWWPKQALTQSSEFGVGEAQIYSGECRLGRQGGAKTSVVNWRRREKKVKSRTRRRGEGLDSREADNGFNAASDQSSLLLRYERDDL